MAYLAVRGSGAVNGVSRLHGKVSRRIFQPLFPRWPEDEVPVGHVTNGVHMSSWDSEESRCALDRSMRQGPLAGHPGDRGSDMRRFPTPALGMPASARETLIEYVRQRVSRQLEAAGASPRGGGREASLIPTR